MKYFSTFSGIGGFEIGIHNAYRSKVRGIEEDSQSDQGSRLQPTSGEDISATQRPVSERVADILNERPLCVGYSEIDKYATSVYEKHFKGVKNYGDITKINAEELPNFDCLVGGFPCQAFSIAGKRGGFNDTRGTLFFDLARILREKQPRYFVFENVKGLLSHDKGNTFRTIIATINELGYDCQWQVLNSKNFGVPQNRERIFIVGHLRGTARPKVFPITGQSNENTTIGKSTETSVARALTAGGNSGGNHSGMTIIQQFGENRYSDISPTLRTPTGGNRLPMISNPKMNNYKGSSEHSVAITATSYKEPPVVNQIRRLTPLECERLQAFPDNWTNLAADGTEISDTQRYKMCGNAVTTNVVQAVFEKIFKERE